MSELPSSPEAPGAIAPGASGNVVAVGVDLADVARVRQALTRFPERFVARVLTESEAAYCLSKPDPAPHITARFAAKEAVIKCLGGGCDLKDIEVTRALSGAPSITLTGRAAEKAAGRKVLISLSHLPDIACAFATLVEVA
ncbi:MAG: holo-ACP synthase [Armatimonas sp.]